MIMSRSLLATVTSKTAPSYVYPWRLASALHVHFQRLARSSWTDLRLHQTNGKLPLTLVGAKQLTCLFLSTGITKSYIATTLAWLVLGVFSVYAAVWELHSAK
jgi:hypothetical protein